MVPRGVARVGEFEEVGTGRTERVNGGLRVFGCRIFLTIRSRILLAGR